MLLVGRDLYGASLSARPRAHRRARGSPLAYVVGNQELFPGRWPYASSSRASSRVRRRPTSRGYTWRGGTHGFSDDLVASAGRAPNAGVSNSRSRDPLRASLLAARHLAVDGSLGQPRRASGASQTESLEFGRHRGVRTEPSFPRRPPVKTGRRKNINGSLFFRSYGFRGRGFEQRRGPTASRVTAESRRQRRILDRMEAGRGASGFT